ncbi:MAG: InlB B-repeat-containing protein [Treponema sp.]|nr:InlB B-repeat-containing protein [Treponema sp.]
MPTKIISITSILLLLLCAACTLEDTGTSKNEPGTSTVTFNANGGSGSAPPAQTVKAGTSITIPNAGSLSWVNHTFGGWNTNAAGTGINYPPGSSFTVPGADITLFAKWDNNKPENTEIKQYNIAGNHSYVFDKGFPATIEIYALGSGGGGQGGHYSYHITNPMRGTGGAGGGGAASYVKFTITVPTVFTITVGSGGNPGTAKQVDIGTWQSGNPGSNGGNTELRWESNVLTAQGGRGGGGSGQILTGGSGGSANTAWPSGNLDSLSVSGGSGTAGISRGDIMSRGGNAASINIGTVAPFGGGGGGYREGGEWLPAVNGVQGGGGSSAYGGTGSQNNGGRGGDGYVIIVATY